jgi:hypothetical protein
MCLTAWVVLFFTVSVNLFGDVPNRFKGAVHCIENPTPTHVEKEDEFVELVKIKEIQAEIDDEHFMVRPWFIAVNNEGKIFAFDRMIEKIFNFGNEQSNFKFIKTFGNTGQGPGEYGRQYSVYGIYCSRDGYIFVSDRVNKKIIKFDAAGKHIKDFRVPPEAKTDGGFLPVINTDGEYYVLSGTYCTLDVYNIHDRNLKKHFSLFGKDVCEQSVILKTRKQDYRFWLSLSLGNSSYDILPDNRLIFYMNNTSTIYIYIQNRLVKKFNIWPKEALDVYRKKIAERAKNLGKNGLLIVYMFNYFFMDKDDEDYFYLKGLGRFNGKFLLYRCDLDGNLVKVLYTPFPVRILAKRKGLFYGAYKDSIYILKEETHEK